MTLREFIAKLQTLPNMDAPVMVEGYEGGLHDVDWDLVRFIPVGLNVRKEFYYGPHWPANNDYLRIEADVHAYVIGRGAR